MLKRGPPDRAAQAARRERRRIERMKHYDLSAVSLAVIDRAARVNWFSSVGEPFDSTEVRREASLQTAKRSVLRNAYINVLIDARNEMSGFLGTHHDHRFQTTWNEIVHQVKIRLQGTFDAAVARGMEVLRFSETERQSMHEIVQIPVYGAVHEIEYADVFRADLHQKMFEWYERGHFVCGFDGTWPDVSLVVC
jgi:hypothetical protein